MARRSASQSIVAGRGHDHHGAGHRAQQRGQRLLAQRAAHGVQHILVGRRALGHLHHRHLVRQPEVVAQRLGPLVGALVIGAGEQVLHQLAADPQLGVGHPAQPGQLDREHGRAVLDRHHVGGARAAVRVHQREQAEHAGARRGQGDHAGRRPGPSGPRSSAGGAAAPGRRRAASGTGPAWPGRPTRTGCRTGPPPPRPARSGRAGPRRCRPPLPRRPRPGSGARGSACRGGAWPRSPRSAALVWASSAAIARSRACSCALDTATPVCCATTWARNCSSPVGWPPAQAIMWPIGPAMLRIGYAQAQPPSGIVSLPPVSGSAVQLARSAARGSSRARWASVRQASPDREPGDPPRPERRRPRRPRAGGSARRRRSRSSGWTAPAAPGGWSAGPGARRARPRDLTRAPIAHRPWTRST